MRDISFQPATQADSLYCKQQSQQISSQTGFIGYVRADLGKEGCEFSRISSGFRENKRTDEFKTDLELVIKRLCMGKLIAGAIKEHGRIASACPAPFEGDFRANTEDYSYLLRAYQEDVRYGMDCYCYEKKWLDCHMKRAENGIRFINPHYKDLFRLADGDKIRITDEYGESREYACRYIDETHLEAGDGQMNLYHIREFAELMERNGNTVIPLRSSLPEKCCGSLSTSSEVILIKRGESGYYRTNIVEATPQGAADFANELNEDLGVSRAQAKAMIAGSMFGWAAPAADPKNYDEHGNPIDQRKQKQRDAR